MTNENNEELEAVENELKKSFVVTGDDTNEKEIFDSESDNVEDENNDLGDTDDISSNETIDDIEFELGYRGWRLLCHMKREYPYMIKYRLISSSPKSVSIKPKDFIQRAIKVLNH